MRRRLFVLSILLLPLVWLFRRALFAGEAIAFRDASFYYFPLYQYVQQRWVAGFPLWNPFDGLGQPLLGDPTAAVFYPAKLLFALPLSFPRCFALYLLVHLFLAGLTTYRLAREMRANAYGALLAGVSYQLSGQVLFQYCNPIYLVGAAWLPLALLSFLRIATGRSAMRNAIQLAVTLSFMVLGGAVQTAMHAVLGALLGWLVLLGARRCPHRSTPLWVPCGWLIAACCLAVGLSAVQFLPSLEWSRGSERASDPVPRSLPAWLVQRWESGDQRLDGLWRRDLPRGEHASRIYDFSVGPWRWSELLWPNVSGRFGPHFTRWIQALPGEGRMWTPSLYLGLLSISLACLRLNLRHRRSFAIRWMSWLALLSLLAACGEYGLGWLLDELRYLAGEDYEPAPVLRGWGGLYWLLTVTVPGYIEFRYPAKWWTVGSLGFSLLAAKGWPLLWSPLRSKMFRRVGTLGGALLLISSVIRFVLVQEVPASSAYGPFDAKLSVLHFATSLLHTLVVAGGLYWFSARGRAARSRELRPRSKAGLPGWGRTARQAYVGAVVFCTLELVIAQQWMIHTAEDTSAPLPAASFATWRAKGHGFPEAFRQAASPHRLAQIRQHEMATLMPKYHLLTKQRQLHSISAMTCGDYAKIWEVFATPEGTPPDALVRMLSGQPGNRRAWLVYDWKNVGPRAGSLADWTRRLLRHEGEFLDVQRRAILETDDDVPSPGSDLVAAKGDCWLVDRDMAEELEVAVTVDRRALLVLSEQFYAGWTATVQPVGGERTTAEVYRVNRVMRGVFVPAGRSTVVLQYRPTSFYLGTAISLACWAWVGWCGARWITRRRGA